MNAAEGSPVDIRCTSADDEFSPSFIAADPMAALAAYRQQSEEAARRFSYMPDLSYGPHREQKLDFFPASKAGSYPAPLCVYVHGGNWHESGKYEGAFLAEAAMVAGAAFAAVDYGLAPTTTLAQMVESVALAVSWLQDTSAELCIDADQLTVVGHSAGAHLVSAALSGIREPGPHVRAVMLLSGIFDLAPVVTTYINEYLGLDPAAAAALSPVHHLPLRARAVSVIRGERETSEYARQHDDFVRAAWARGQSAESVVVPGRDHFDLPLQLARPGTEPHRLLVGAIMGATPAGRELSPGRYRPDRRRR